MSIQDIENQLSTLSLKDNDSKGRNSSIEGRKYEIRIFNILKKCKFNDINFNTQTEDELGGCSIKNDLVCNISENIKIGIEVKKYNTPDWTQLSLTYDINNSVWNGSPNNKIPSTAKKIIEEQLNNIKLFNGKIPPFIHKSITYTEWCDIKKTTNDFNDIYIDCDNNTIQKLYIERGCYYIQLSKKGLYHLGNDICGFNVPEFKCEQEIRIRIKVHSKKNNNGFCKLSVTASCKPIKIKELINSTYSLDDIDRLPPNLLYLP